MSVNQIITNLVCCVDEQEKDRFVSVVNLLGNSEALQSQEECLYLLFIVVLVSVIVVDTGRFLSLHLQPVLEASKNEFLNHVNLYLRRGFLFLYRRWHCFLDYVLCESKAFFIDRWVYFLNFKYYFGYLESSFRGLLDWHRREYWL